MDCSNGSGIQQNQLFSQIFVYWHLTQFYSLDTFLFSASINDKCSLEIISLLILSLSGDSKMTDTRIINTFSITKA